MANPIQRAFKRLGSMLFQGGAGRRWWSMFAGRTRYDYAAEVGDGRTNSIYGACVAWICRTFPEAPVKLSFVKANGDEAEQPTHPLKLLLDTPNPYYPGEMLWAATLADRTYSGNAYWLKVRSLIGRPVQIYWVPDYMMEPKWPDDGSKFISHYEYTPGTEPIRIETTEVVHFRWPMFDPRNMRKGYSPVQQLVREIFTDDEAANYTASMLRNVGVPPVILSPADPLAAPSEEELQNTKQRYQDITTGDNRGQALVMSNVTKVDRIGFNPQEMDVRNLRRVPEERISAVLGIPAAVVGLGTGLENTKVGATMAEMREQAYESNIIPTQRLMAAELRTQLLPDFGKVETLKFEFDLSKVRVLQVDEDSLHNRAREDLNAGLVTLDEARQKIGMEPLEGDAGNVFYLPGTITATDPEELLAPPEPLLSLPGVAPQNALPAPADGKEPVAALRARGWKSDALEMVPVDMTPILAREFMRLNDPRRTSAADTALVDTYAAQMKSGQWSSHGDVIQINRLGGLIDGQHRLLAVIKSGWSGPMFLCVGVPEGSAWVMDPPGKAPPKFAERVKQYADIDLAEALMEHALVLAESKTVTVEEMSEALQRKGLRNGHVGLS